MMLKIDAYEIAKAVSESKENRFPKRQFAEQGLFRHNIQSEVNRYKSRNINMVARLDASMITSRTNSYNVKYKECRLFGKVQELFIGQINIILDSQPNSLIFFNNSKAIVLMVANEDILKFDVLLCMPEQNVIDLATFIRQNNIFVDDFQLIV